MTLFYIAGEKLSQKEKILNSKLLGNQLEEIQSNNRPSRIIYAIEYQR